MVDLNWLYQTLKKKMGPSGWWPADSKQEIIIGAILVQNTNWRNAEQSLKSLKKITNFQPQKIQQLTDPELRSLIKSSGFYHHKAQTIRQVYQWFDQRQWNFSLKENETSQILRRKLLKIPGIGNETADVYLVYIFDLPEFIADHYTRRLFKKLGYLHTETYEHLKKQVTLPTNFTYSDAQDFHGLIDEFGKIYLTHRQKFQTSFLAQELKKQPH